DAAVDQLSVFALQPRDHAGLERLRFCGRHGEIRAHARLRNGRDHLAGLDGITHLGQVFTDHARRSRGQHELAVLGLQHGYHAALLFDLGPRVRDAGFVVRALGLVELVLIVGFARAHLAKRLLQLDVAVELGEYVAGFDLLAWRKQLGERSTFGEGELY